MEGTAFGDRIGEAQDHFGTSLAQETNPIIDWEKGTLEWRNPKPINPFEMARKLAKQAIKYSSDKQRQEIQNRTAATISEEEDEEDHLNSTQNPLDNNDLALLVSSITDEMDTNTWINAKMSTATEIQTELNLKKEEVPLREQVPKEFHDFLDIFSLKKKQLDSPNLDHGTTRLR